MSSFSSPEVIYLNSDLEKESILKENKGKIKNLLFNYYYNYFLIFFNVLIFLNLDFAMLFST